MKYNAEDKGVEDRGIEAMKHNAEDRAQSEQRSGQKDRGQRSMDNAQTDVQATVAKVEGVTTILRTGSGTMSGRQ